MTDKQLTQRMREAADVLEEAANRFYPNEGLGSIYAHWSSDSLNRVADQWDAEVAEETLVEDLAAEIRRGLEDDYWTRARSLMACFDIRRKP